MSCHKVSRALLERFRFGELDADCDEYLAHVERCADCQAEIAIDRALARNLRQALRDRVEGFEPSPAVWRAVRLQAADPEPPGPWWSTALVSLGRAMRVMVPATAFLLAAVLAWTGPEPGADQAASSSPLASRMQWQEQLSTTAAVEILRERQVEVIPTPSVSVPRPAGEMPFAEPVARIKVYAPLPSMGGMAR